MLGFWQSVPRFAIGIFFGRRVGLRMVWAVKIAPSAACFVALVIRLGLFVPHVRIVMTGSGRPLSFAYATSCLWSIDHS
ncbi:hypothetical protein DNK56_08165 [Streptomyces sp. AC1-42W]|nr:hypothetical protein DNK55_23280 [Streptomyces sp. AC1-42T]PZT82058.1 hypothetical protein DNK56_08165 [Streptomyces sp. AC1-42W]